MLITDVPGVYNEALPLADELDDSFELSFNVFIFQNLSSVLGCPDEMILADICTMAELIDSPVCHTKITSFLGVIFSIYPRATLSTHTPAKAGGFC